jgi:hypothetical protein
VEKEFPDERDYCAWARHEQARTMAVQGHLDDAQRARLSVESDFPERRGRCARALVDAGWSEPDGQASRRILLRAAAYRDWLRWSAVARYLLGEIPAKEFARTMFDWHWRADVEYWRGEAALRQGRTREAARRLRRALELNVPGYTWPALEARSRLAALGESPPSSEDES